MTPNQKPDEKLVDAALARADRSYSAEQRLLLDDNAQDFPATRIRENIDQVALRILADATLSLRAELAEETQQRKLGWQRAAEKDVAYGDMIKQRDEWEKRAKQAEAQLAQARAVQESEKIISE